MKSSHGFLNTLLSEQNGPHFADNIFKYLFWIKIFVFSIKFHWSLIIGIQLAISQRRYSLWLGTSSASCHKPMVIYDIVNIIGPLFTHFGLVSCLGLSQWPLAFLMRPSDWTMSCHVLIMDDGRGWKHHRGTYKFLCRMDNFSGIYFNYIDINYIYILTKITDFFIWHSERCLSNW